MGLIVDKVTEVAWISADAVEPPSPLIANIDTAYLRGIGKFKMEAAENSETENQQKEEQMVILLDLDRVFSQGEQQMLTQTA